jgi:hypothetical protein
MVMLLNLTPHDIHIVNSVGTVLTTIPKQDQAARLVNRYRADGMINGIQLTKTVYTEVTGLPEPREGVYLIVSSIVKEAFLDREDLLIPHQLVRNENGMIIGCQSLGTTL